MFYAMTEDGSRVEAGEYGQRSGEGECFCPGCRERVFLKKGEIKTPHFAHYRETGCSTFSEGETELHLLGKRLLMEWLEEQGVDAEMEPWLPHLKQRPDVLVHLREGRRIVLEYQCSPIPLQRIRERTEGYRREGYEVIWLLGVDYALGGRLRDKQVAFMTWSPTAAYSLLCLDSERGELQLYHHIHFDGRDHLRYAKERKPLTRLTLIEFLALASGELTPSPPFPSLQTVRGLTKRQRMLLLRRRDAEHRRFLERIYLQRHSLSELPDLLFQKPTKSLLYATPGYIWKYDFLLWLGERGEGSTIEAKDMECYCHQAIQSRVLRIRPGLELAPCQYVQPMLDFLAIMTEGNMATLISPGCWFLKSLPLRRA